jgi:RNA polymerase sigma-70 factor (ECF subfamily)
LQTWIFRVATNKTRDFVERQHAAKRGGGRLPISLQAPTTEQGLVLDPPSPAASPDAQLLQDEELVLVRCALARLGEPCREIIALRYFGDLSYEEIAATLRLNPKTVSSRLSKCLDRLEMIARPLFRAGKAEKATPFSV